MGVVAHGPFTAGNVANLVRAGSSKTWLPQFGYPVESSFGGGESYPKPQVDVTTYIQGANTPVVFAIPVPNSAVSSTFGGALNLLGSEVPLTADVVNNSEFGVCLSYWFTTGSLVYTDWLRFLQFPDDMLPAGKVACGIQIDCVLYTPGVNPFAEVLSPPTITLYTLTGSLPVSSFRHASLRR